MVDIIENINAKRYWEAPTEIPAHIDSKRKAKLNGSLTAVLNLITDKAPTNPSERASDDLTTAINDATLIIIKNIEFPKAIFEENVLVNLLYKNLKYNPIPKAINNIVNEFKKLKFTE